MLRHLLDPRTPAWLARLTHSLLRAITGALFMQHGAQKLFGLFTRPVAFLLAGEMAVAYFQAHAPRAFRPILNGGEPVVLFCFVFLYLFATGAGPYSFDAAILGRRQAGDARA